MDPPKLNEWAAIIFGATGFAMSLVTWFRARASDRRTQQLTYASDKQEALLLLYQEELEVERQSRKLTEVTRRAEIVGATELFEWAKPELTRLHDNRKTLVEMRVGFDKFKAASATHEQHVLLRESSIPKLLQFKAEREQADSIFNLTISEAEKTIELHAKLREIGIDPPSA